MATPNQQTETESGAHLTGAAVDPFAVDFFGGATPLAGEEELFLEKTVSYRKRSRPAKKSDWYKNLPRIANREAEFSNLLSNLPENLTENAVRIICETLARYIFRPAENVRCELVSVKEVNLNRALGKQSETPKVFLTIGGRTEKSPAIAALDVGFASGLIDSMLDGPGAPLANRSEISPVETTILEFLAANILREINNFTGESVFFLENVKPPRADFFEPFERGAEFVLSVDSGDSNGVVTFYAPRRFLKIFETLPNSLLTSKAGRKNLSEFEKIARELRLRLQIGATFLDADSLSYLEPDDIVLIEQPQIYPENVDFGKNLQVYVGSGRNFRLRGNAEAGQVDGGLNFKIEEILSEEARRKFTAAKFIMDEKENEPLEETAFESEAPGVENMEEEIPDEQLSPSLENIQVALRVEIAGSKISLRELQNLRAGQIIALGCSPTDPVRLVTDNNEEPVATGELIEIEGQLGVRLTKVFI